MEVSLTYSHKTCYIGVTCLNAMLSHPRMRLPVLISAIRIQILLTGHLNTCKTSWSNNYPCVIQIMGFVKWVFFWEFGENEQNGRGEQNRRQRQRQRQRQRERKTHTRAHTSLKKSKRNYRINQVVTVSLLQISHNLVYDLRRSIARACICTNSTWLWRENVKTMNEPIVSF